MTKQLLVPPFLAGLMISGTPVVALARQCLGELRELGRSLLVALVLGSPALAQDVLALEPGLGLYQQDGGESSVAVTFVGSVDGPDGAPAEGAIVVSSAGGQAVTDGNGSYSLDVHVPVGAERVQITAVGAAAANLSASTSVLLSSGRVQVGPLLLAEGGTCSPGWLPTFGQQPGVGGNSGAPIGVFDLTVFDDGSGPALYAGGYFTTAGSTEVSYIAKWNGSSWTALGSGVNGIVVALAVFDDGSGPALYAGGSFTIAGGVQAKRIAKWDGSSWSALGSGMNGDVGVLAVFDDGSGPALYAGGGFTTAGGVATWGIAKWSGSSWTTPGGGVSFGFQGGHVFALLVIDDGGQPALCVGGSFDKAGGVAANNIATWNGSSWATLGSGMNGGVGALVSFDEGSGPVLHAGGSFTTAGGVAANNIATWDGSSWAPLGSGTNSGVYDLTTFDDGTGPALYAAGGFWTAGGVTASRIAKWNGSSWAPLGTGLGTIGTGSVGGFSLAVFDDGGGAALYAGGSFMTAGFTLASGEVANHIARWNGSSWTPLGSGLDSPVDALLVFDDGSGPAIYAGGGFTVPLGGFGANNLAKWDGASWTALGSGSSGWVANLVWAMAVFDDGSGPALYAGANSMSGTTSRGGTARAGRRSATQRTPGCLP